MEESHPIPKLDKAIKELSKKFFVSLRGDIGILVLHPARDVSAQEVLEILGKDDFYIENVHMPSFQRAVVKVSLF